MTDQQTAVVIGAGIGGSLPLLAWRAMDSGYRR
jgi:hypothetical protein